MQSRGRSEVAVALGRFLCLVFWRRFGANEKAVFGFPGGALSQDEEFVAFLDDERAHRFIERAAAAMEIEDRVAVGPDPCSCGPCGAAWSMPLPGEWLRFGTSGHVVESVAESVDAVD